MYFRAWVVAVAGLLVSMAAGVGGASVAAEPRGEASAPAARWMVERDGEWGVVVVGPDPVTELRELAADPSVTRVRPEAIYTAADVPDDPCLTENNPACVADTGRVGFQWYLDTVGAVTAWSETTGDPSVTVAVLDSGVRSSHVELDGGRVLDWSSCGITPNDLTHGTRVAGLVGAEADDGQGIAGLGWRTQLADIPVLERVGGSLQGRESDVIVALDCAVARGADVINMSFSGPPTPALGEALARAAAAGVVLVAAAGNDGTNQELYPGAHPDVVAVAATTRSESLADFSSRGPWVSLAAPGQDLFTIDGFSDTDYAAAVDGTSFSAPLVSAAAALLLAAHPDWDAPQVTARLLRTAARSPGVEVSAGHLRAGAALVAADDALWMVAADGSMGFAGDASDRGTFDAGDVVAVAATPSGRGYLTAASDGGVFAFGDAGFFGSMGATVLNRPIVGMAATPSGGGYWLVASDGGVFAFGDAGFFGSMGATVLNRPIVGMAATPSGGGYWLVASDGGVFAFGDAGFFGSTGSIALNRPIRAMAVPPAADGYWLIAADGGVFGFGDVSFHGSLPGEGITANAVGAVSSPSGLGYRVVTDDGSISAFGDAEELPVTSLSTSQPIVAVAGP